MDKSKPLWTKKGFLASNDPELLAKAARIARENDQVAVNLLLVEGAVFLTGLGIPVFWETSGFQSEMSQVRLKGSLKEFWVLDEALTNTAPPEPPPEVVVTSTVPMSKETLEKIEADQAAQAKQQRELFNRQEAEREANGDFSQAPGLTPEQREAAAVHWAEQDAAKRIKAGKPYPQ